MQLFYKDLFELLQEFCKPSLQTMMFFTFFNTAYQVCVR